MLRTPPLLALALGFPVALGAQLAPADLDRAAATITESDYARRIGIIAHDSMRGRNTPSPGLDATAAWIAAELRGFGLRGGAEHGGFIQRIPLVEESLDVARSGIVSGDVRLSYGPDVLPLARGGHRSVEVRGGLVVVSGSRDPVAAFAGGLDGAHVALVAGRGAGADRALYSLMGAAQAAGAGSVLLVTAADDAAWSAGAARALRPSVRTGWGDGARRGEGGELPILQMRAAALERLVRDRSVDLASLQGRSGEAVRVDRVPGLSLTLTQHATSREVGAPNVVGILEGSDPVLRNEYVVFSAHMDHVGVGTPDERGDSIFNGADDDASGTVAVVEVAEAMASLQTPPRRSMLFLLVSGEEHGLWGSEYFASHPTVSIDNVVANLNADMVGRNWPDTIVAIGKEHSDLGATLERVNGAHPELRMTAIDDLWPEERFYFRSDHYNFARNGVPILFFFNGTHEDYHGRDDEPDRIDAEKASRIAKLLFYLGSEIGNAEARPRWNPESYRQIVTGSGR